MNQEMMKILEGVEAVRQGHFLLSSGKHSNVYFQMALALQHSEVAEKIAQGISNAFEDRNIDVVIGPAIGAIVLSQEVGRAVNARSLFSERDADGNMILRRGFEIQPDEKVLIVEDVFTTGGSALKVVDLVKKHGGEIVGIATIINRSGKEKPQLAGINVTPLLSVKAENYEPDSCPLCKNNVPFYKPGSNPKA